MALDANGWHILSICLFPVISLGGIFLAAALGSDTTNKLIFTMGVMFSSGILLAGALVHSLPHSQALFAELQGGGHDDHGGEDGTAHAEEGAHSDAAEDDHGHDHLLYRYLQAEEEADDHAHAYPWAAMIFGCSFLVLMCIEAIAERMIDRFIGEKAGNLYAHGHGHDEKDGHGDHGHGHDHNDHDEKKKMEAVKEEEGGGGEDSQTRPQEEAAAAAATPVTEATPPATDTESLASTETTKPVMVRAGSSAVRSQKLRQSEAEGGTDASGGPRRRRRSSALLAVNMLSNSKFNPDDYIDDTFLVTAKRPSVMGVIQVNDVTDVDEKQTINPWVAILLLLVLSIHVLLEGLTLGSTQSVNAIKSIFVAVVFHKGFSAFALGSSLITSGYWDKDRPNGGRRMFYILALVYASMDVIGIGAGMGLANSFDTDSYGNAVLQALLGGSFLFVATSELIPGELEKMRVFQFPVVPVLFSLLLGYALMSLIGKWA